MNELLYQKNQAVAALNRVEGFEPLEFARTIKQEDQEDQLYLDVKYRKLWFRLANPLGRISSHIVWFNENVALAEAKIYLNYTDAPENYIANAFSMKFRSEDPKFGDKFLEMAETAAVGRALSDAGYGVQFADVGESNDPAQVDAGIPVPLQYPEAAAGAPSYGGQPVSAGQPDCREHSRRKYAVSGQAGRTQSQPEHDEPILSSGPGTGKYDGSVCTADATICIPKGNPSGREPFCGGAGEAYDL